jgi:hypothetical protein
MTLALPALAQFDGAQPDKKNLVPNAEFLAENLFAIENCDALAQVGELNQIIDAVAGKFGANAVVCVLPGTAKLTLNLKHHGLRVIALQPGSVTIDVAYIGAPTVLIGLNLSSLAIDKGAAGSVVALSSFGKGLSMTSEVTLVANRSKTGYLEGPMGQMSETLYLPHYAKDLALAMGKNTLSASQQGDRTVAGWLNREALTPGVAVAVQGTKGKGLGKVAAKENSKKPSGNQTNFGDLNTAINWFGQTPLVSHTSPNREGESLKRGQDVPVYQNPEAADKPIAAMFFVPLHTGLRPDLKRKGVILAVR